MDHNEGPSELTALHGQAARRSTVTITPPVRRRRICTSGLVRERRAVDLGIVASRIDSRLDLPRGADPKSISLRFPPCPIGQCSSLAPTKFLGSACADQTSALLTTQGKGKRNKKIKGKIDTSWIGGRNWSWQVILQLWRTNNDVVVTASPLPYRISPLIRQWVRFAMEPKSV